MGRNNQVHLSVIFDVEWHDNIADSSYRANRSKLPRISEMTEYVRASVFDVNGNKVQEGGQWLYSDREGVIENVPVGSDLRIVIYRYQEEPFTKNVLYQGEVRGITVVGDETSDAGTVECTLKAIIVSPQNAKTYDEGDVITFQGEGTGQDDDFVWNSSIAGQIGTGSSFNKSDMTRGRHIITLTVTDSDEISGKTLVEITVEQKYSFSGKFKDNNEPVANRTVEIYNWSEELIPPAAITTQEGDFSFYSLTELYPGNWIILSGALSPSIRFYAIHPIADNYISSGNINTATSFAYEIIKAEIAQGDNIQEDNVDEELDRISRFVGADFNSNGITDREDLDYYNPQTKLISSDLEDYYNLLISGGNIDTQIQKSLDNLEFSTWTCEGGGEITWNGDSWGECIPIVSVPDVSNMTEAQAKTAIENAELTVGIISSEYSTVEKGYVIRLEPASGNQVPKGSTVNIVVSLWLEMVSCLLCQI